MEKQNAFAYIAIERNDAGLPVTGGRKTNRNKNKKKSPINRWVKRISLLLLFLVAIAVGAKVVITAVWYYPGLHFKMASLLHHRYSSLQGRPVVVKTGDRYDITSLKSVLLSIGMHEQNNSEKKPPCFQQDESTILVHFSRRNIARIDIEKGHIALITDENNTVHQEVTLGSPILTSFSQSLWEVRYPLYYAQLPETLVQAIIATEDGAFFSHPGIDIRGIGRAAIENLKQGRVVQGGSTITQQVVKSILGRTDRELELKIEEAILSLLIELFYSKEEIFEAYCNTIYLGQIGPFAVHGFGAAARHLLHKEITELSPADCAILAGLIHSPNPLSPLRHPEAAIKRGNIVLAQMKKNNPAVEESAIKPDYLNDLDSTSRELIPLAWYYRQVQKELNEKKQIKDRLPLTIELALDPAMQRAAQEKVAAQLVLLDKSGKQDEQLQAALAVVDVESGGVTALIGGRDYTNNQFNRAVDSKRQVGSLIKPFVYLAAMETVESDLPLQSQQVYDLPLIRSIDGKKWRPKNYDRKFLGRITWRRALAESRNIPAVRLGEQAGIENVRGLIKDVEINDTPSVWPSLYLGAVESSPLKMASAYRVFAAGGEYKPPFFIKSIKKNNRLLYHADQTVTRVTADSRAYVMTDMLKAVLKEGTGRSSKNYVTGPAAGKTGSTSRLVDGWFAGLTPELATAVWVGYDSGKPMGFTGGRSALPIWGALSEGSRSKKNVDFSLPDTIQLVNVDRKTGKPLKTSTKGVTIAMVDNRNPVLKALEPAFGFDVVKEKVASSYEKVSDTVAAALTEIPKNTIRPLSEKLEPFESVHLADKIHSAFDGEQQSEIRQQVTTKLDDMQALANTSYQKIKQELGRAKENKKSKPEIVSLPKKSTPKQKLAPVKPVAIIEAPIDVPLPQSTNTTTVTASTAKKADVSGHGTPLAHQKYKYFNR